MEHRIYTAAEARALLDGTTEGPWTARHGRTHALGKTFIVESDSLDVDVAVVLDVEAPRDQADAALIAAAPDLAASVEHHAARADAAEKRAGEWAHRAGEAEARVAVLTAALRDHTDVCSFCGRGGSWCCVDRSRSAADALRSLSAKDGAP